MTKSTIKKIEIFFGYTAAIVLILSIGVFIGSRSRTTPHKKSSLSGTIDKSRLGATNGICVQAIDIDSGEFTPLFLKLYDKSYALLIGIDEYDVLKTGFPPLKQAVKDTEKVRAKLGEFQFNSIMTLKNSHATKQNLLHKMKMLMREAGPNGALFIYFAGHGYRHPNLKGKGYLIPYNGSRKLSELDKRDISMASLRKLAKEANVKHVFFALDCCYSALFCSRQPQISSGGTPDIYRLAQLTAEPVINVIAATGRDEPGVDGLFADSFINALDMFKQNAFVTAGDIAYYISKDVPRRARKLFRVQNTASTKLFPSAGEFVFARTNDIVKSYIKPKLSLINTFKFTNIQDHSALNICDIDDNGSPDFLRIGLNTIEILNDLGICLFKKTFNFKPNQYDKLRLYTLEDITMDGCKEIIVGYTINSTNWFYVLDHQLHTLRTISNLNTIFSKLTIKKNDIIKNNLQFIVDKATNVSKRLAKTWFEDDIWAVSNQFKGMVWVVDGNSKTVDLFFTAIQSKNLATNSVSPELLLNELNIKGFWCGQNNFNSLSNYGVVFTQKTTAQDITMCDVNSDYYPDLLATFAAGYGWTPRGVVAFDFRTCKPLWRFPTVCGAEELDSDFDFTTGEKIILFSGNSSCTGFKKKDGTDDSHVYAYLLTHDGNLIWRKEMGGAFNFVQSQFVDLDMDGNVNVLVVIEDHLETGLNRTGHLYLLDKNNGEPLFEFSVKSAIDSFSILPDYENRQNTVLIGLRNGKVVHLDSKLKVINSVSLFKSDKLKNSDTWRARTEIKGLLHTFYGEFIVVYYMERKSNFSGVRMDIGFHKHFIRNEQLLLLNAKTLQIEFTVPICINESPEVELLNNNQNYSAVQDIDQDGQEELLLAHKDRIDVYKFCR